MKQQFTQIKNLAEAFVVAMLLVGSFSCGGGGGGYEDAYFALSVRFLMLEDKIGQTCQSNAAKIDEDA